MVLEPDDFGDFVHERDAQPLVMVRAKSEPVVSEAEPQANRGVPTMRTRDECMVDVVERGLHVDSPVGGDQFVGVGDIDAVIVAHAQR